MPHHERTPRGRTNVVNVRVHRSRKGVPSNDGTRSAAGAEDDAMRVLVRVLASRIEGDDTLTKRASRRACQLSAIPSRSRPARKTGLSSQSRQSREAGWSHADGMKDDFVTRSHLPRQSQGKRGACMSRSLYFSVALSLSLLACGSTIDVGQNNVDGGGVGDSATTHDRMTGPQSCAGSDAGVGDESRAHVAEHPELPALRRPACQHRLAARLRA